MNYISLSFYIFLAVSFAVYFTVPGKARQFVLLVSSLVFYLSSGIYGILFLFATFLITWLTTRRIAAVYSQKEFSRQEMKAQAKKYVAAALVLIFAMLFFFKIWNLAASSIARFSETKQFLSLLLPLGLSYYTFSSVGYILDVYWRKAEFEPDAVLLFTCMIYFPHIVEGPIGQYDKLMPQFRKLPGFRRKEVCFGLQLMLWGFFKKLVIADRIAIITGTIFGDVYSYPGWYLFLGMILNVIQLYTDFSGCMDIVTGISEVYGIQLERNFNHPFEAVSIADFWRRWHITLCRWFRSYIYMPMSTAPWHIQNTLKIRRRFGKGASKAFATIVPMLVVWVLTGLWHGTGWDYLMWGGYYGLLMSLSVLLKPQIQIGKKFFHVKENSNGWRLFQRIRTFLLFAFGRMITVLGSWKSVLTVFHQMLRRWNPWILFDGSLYSLGVSRPGVILMVLTIFLLFAVEHYQQKGSVREWIAGRNIVLRWAIYYVAIFSVLIFGIYGMGYNAADFAYGRF